ncbi:protein pygopus [Uranotaenia lowii]|uniref:protein pygopus n=1 Tax=Uranotaenia lowii TaxID=190385 RepID=UPI002479E133|nr:protein pygopus [Uranotaenia lowii]
MSAKGQDIADSWEQIDEERLASKLSRLTSDENPSSSSQSGSKAGVASKNSLPAMLDEELRPRMILQRPQQMQILRRPQAKAQEEKAAAESKPKTQLKSLDQRKQEYAEARLRILGSAHDEEEQQQKQVEQPKKASPVINGYRQNSATATASSSSSFNNNSTSGPSNSSNPSGAGSSTGGNGGGFSRLERPQALYRTSTNYHMSPSQPHQQQQKQHVNAPSPYYHQQGYLSSGRSPLIPGDPTSNNHYYHQQQPPPPPHQFPQTGPGYHHYPPQHHQPHSTTGPSGIQQQHSMPNKHQMAPLNYGAGHMNNSYQQHLPNHLNQQQHLLAGIGAGGNGGPPSSPYAGSFSGGHHHNSVNNNVLRLPAGPDGSHGFTIRR